MSLADKKKYMGVHCDKCDVYIPNETSLAAHLKGKKHLKNVERINTWEESARKSLYISGIQSCLAAELELADYFSKFGKIAKVTVDKNAGSFAILEFAEKESTTKALAVEQHFLGSKKITVKQREVKIPTAKKDPNQRRVVHNQMSSEVWNILLACTDVDEQVNSLHACLSLDENELHLRELICKLLHSAFVEVFPSCEVQPFGSSVNGYGVHGCDLDLNFCYDVVNHGAAVQFLPTDTNDNLPTPGRKDLTEKQIIVVISEIIKQCVPDCHQVKAILTARRPVVKFEHRASDIQCDISVGNALAVRNTAFLKHLRHNIPYLGPFVQVVRQWMKHWNLAGSSVAASPHLNNYAVTLMVLFYLNNRQPPELEPLDTMRSKYQNSTPCNIEGWDCSFPDAITNLKADAAESSLRDLLSGFFQYYSKFDFSECILCLRSGKLLPAAEAKTGISSREGRRSFKYGALNIRDPFELCHNVAGNVGRKHMHVFMKCIRNANLACEMKLYAKKSGNGKEPWGILNLFVDHHKKTPEKRQRKSSKDGTAYVLDLQNTTQDPNWQENTAATVVVILEDIFMVNVEWEDKSDANGLHADGAEITTGNDAGMQPVAVNVRHGNGDVVDPPTNIEARKRSHTVSPSCHKRARLDIDSAGSAAMKQKVARLGEFIKLPVHLKCETTYKVWEGRRKARRRLVQPGLSDMLALEKQVSRLLVSEIQSSGAPGDGNTSMQSCSSMGSVGAGIGFDLDLDRTEHGLKLYFHHKPSDASDSFALQEFQNFFHYLETSLPNIVAKCNKAG